MEFFLTMIGIFAVFVILYFILKDKKEDQKKEVLMSEKEEEFTDLLREIFQQESINLCFSGCDSVCFDINIQDSETGPLFVFSMNGKSDSVNVREEMKKVTFLEDGRIVYDEELICLMRDKMFKLIQL